MPIGITYLLLVRTCTCYVAVAVPVRTDCRLHSTGSSMTSSFYFIVGIDAIRCAHRLFGAFFDRN